MLKLVRR